MKRFWTKVAPPDADGCRNWMGATVNGYGVFWLNGRNVKAHRVAWTLEHGPVPDGLCVCHRCDNRLCVDVAHLFLGTGQENTADKVQKGRQATGEQTRPETRAKGERQHLAKLTEAAVLEIRSMAGTCSLTDLAARFGVDRTAVRRVIRRETWKHV